jgi:hypothetical protein
MTTTVRRSTFSKDVGDLVTRTTDTPWRRAVDGGNGHGRYAIAFACGTGRRSNGLRVPSKLFLDT